ncbi:TPA: glycosyltransferase WbuB [bacterium]|nr:glycosyltransferase WbuB [bacterium]
MPKSIWILNHYAVTPDMPGGSRHYDLGKELVSKGYDVTIFASSFHYSKHEELKLSGKESFKVEYVNGVRFLWIKTMKYNGNNWRRIINMLSYSFRSYFVGRKAKKLNITQPDVIIGSSVHLFAVLSAYYLAKYHKARFLMEVRDLWPQTLVDMGALSEKSIFTKAMYALEKFLYKRAEKIITLLPSASDYITKLGVSDDKIVWIPNGVDLSKFNGDYKSKTKTDQKFRILYLGAHGQANALDVLIDAARNIQDDGYSEIQFELVGDGAEKQRLIERAKQLDINNISFKNPIPKSDVPIYLTKFDAFLHILLDAELFTKYGISSNKIFDYLAAGKPIIMSCNPGNNIIDEAKCGILVPPNDPQALANSVIKLYKMDTNERAIMGKNGRKYVEKYHDIKILAQKLIDNCLK